MTPEVAAFYNAPSTAIRGHRAAAPELAEAPEPEQVETCAVCAQVEGSLFDGGDWQDRYGDLLPEARMTPAGVWVCSAHCYSDQMYRSADERTRAKLNAVADAVTVLTEVMDAPLRDYLHTWLFNAPRTASNVTALDFARDAVRFQKELSQDAEPSWLDRPAETDRLRDVIRTAVKRLENRVLPDLSISARIAARENDRFHTRYASSVAGENACMAVSTANIVADLREALEL